MKSDKRHVSRALSISSMLEIEDNHEFEKILGNTNLDELNITYSLMTEQHDVSKELLSVASAPTDNANGIMGMVLCDGRCGDTRVGLDSCQGSFERSSHSPPCHTVAFVQIRAFIAYIYYM